MGIDGARSSQSGIRLGMQRVAVAASNLVGASDPDYERLRVEPVAAATGGVEARVTSDGDSVELTDEALEMLEGQAEVAVNSRVLWVEQQMEGFLLDVVA